MSAPAWLLSGHWAHAALVTFNSFLYEMRTGDPAEMAALLDRVNTGPGRASWVGA